MASVLVAEIRPAATLLIWRSLFTAPTLTTPVGVAPANPLYVCVPTVALDVATAAAVTAPVPSATLFAVDAVALHPSAMAFAPVTDAPGPIAMEF